MAQVTAHTRGARLRWLALLALLVSVGSWAAPQFPALTGRVVDDAGLLDVGARQRLTAELTQFEQGSGIQLVVVTLPDLQGYEIADYGYQLGRHWGIGQKGKDNGVLLIVARREHRVRIEVGYGLEGTLTDALSSSIINSVIVPRFRQGQFADGITRGAEAIMQVLKGDYKPQPAPDEHKRKRSPWLFILFMIFLFPTMLGGFFGRRRGFYYFPGGGFGGGGFGGGGFGGGGGFSGGGGSFGGGGASGGW